MIKRFEESPNTFIYNHLSPLRQMYHICHFAKQRFKAEFVNIYLLTNSALFNIRMFFTLILCSYVIIAHIRCEEVTACHMRQYTAPTGPT